tara:strand:- start:2132 stop:2758 length:627 start_codon:yes stop_codon:yes gene_type:complete
MVFINLFIKSNNQLQPSETYKSHVVIDNNRTIYDYFKILIDTDDMAKYCTYMYNNKCLGYEIPITDNLYTIFGTKLSVELKEVSFTIPMNPFKRVNWLMKLHDRNLFDIINLNEDEPINKKSIGTWRSWGKLPHNIEKNVDNHPENLVIIEDFNQKWAYNKYQLLSLIESSKNTTILLPHTSLRHNRKFISESLENVIENELPIIKIT